MSIFSRGYFYDWKRLCKKQIGNGRGKIGKKILSGGFRDTYKRVNRMPTLFTGYFPWGMQTMLGKRGDRVEPNKDCYEAVKIVMKAKYDYSGGATYFESCDDEDNWHSRNLEFLYESEGMRFYK